MPIKPKIKQLVKRYKLQLYTDIIFQPHSIYFHMFVIILIYFSRHNAKKMFSHIEITPSLSVLSRRSSVGVSGGRLNKKDGLTRCGDSHVKDKTS